MTTAPGRRVGNRRKGADIGIPQDGTDALDRAALDRSGMNAPAGVVAQIGSEKARSDRVAGMRHHRQRDDRQHRLQQHEIVVVEAAPAGRSRRNSRSPVPRDGSPFAPKRTISAK